MIAFPADPNALSSDLSLALLALSFYYSSIFKLNNEFACKIAIETFSTKVVAKNLVFSRHNTADAKTTFIRLS